MSNNQLNNLPSTSQSNNTNNRNNSNNMPSTSSGYYNNNLGNLIAVNNRSTVNNSSNVNNNDMSNMPSTSSGYYNNNLSNLIAVNNRGTLNNLSNVNNNDMNNMPSTSSGYYNNNLSNLIAVNNRGTLNNLSNVNNNDMNNMPSTSSGYVNNVSNPNTTNNANSANSLDNVWGTNAADSLGATCLFYSEPDNNDAMNARLSKRIEQLPPMVNDEPVPNRFGPIGPLVPIQQNAPPMQRNVPIIPGASDESNPLTQSSSSSSPFDVLAGLNDNNSPPGPSQMWLSAIGNNVGLISTSQLNATPQSNATLQLNATPQLNGSPESGNIPVVRVTGIFRCGYCRADARYYCNTCNEAMCISCIQPHFSSTTLRRHHMQQLRSPSPKPWSTPTNSPQEGSAVNDRECALHFEPLTFVCEQCKGIVCQGCTLRDHYDHKTSTIEEYTKNPSIIIGELFEKSDEAKQDIKRMIDRVVVYINHLERDMNDVALARRRHPRVANALITAKQAADQEIVLTEIMERFRNANQQMFTDVTNGLRAALAGIAAVTDELRRRGAFEGLDSFALAKLLLDHDSKIEHHLKQYARLAECTQCDVFTFYREILRNMDDPQMSLTMLAQNLNTVNSWNIDIQALLNNGSQSNSNVRDRERNRDRDRDRDRLPRRAIVARNHQQNDSVQSFFSQVSQQNQFWNPQARQAMQPAQAHSNQLNLLAVQTAQAQSQAMQPAQTHCNQLNLLAVQTAQAQAAQAQAAQAAHAQAAQAAQAQAAQAAQAQAAQAAHAQAAQAAQMHHSAHNMHMQNEFSNQSPFNGNDMFAMAASQPMLQPPNMRAQHKNAEKNPGYGQCIFNLGVKVSVNHRFIPTVAFGGDGCEEGQLSRPWGICVDKLGQIIIGDRRNNRIQIFGTNGEFKFAFGTKGTGDGELDLPAGITVDIQNRIVVADKDNHRVQIFSACGRFVLKFGSYGRGLGEFQYPWDVATNSAGHIVVSDTRNHRIQMFSGYGHFITKFSFDDIPGPSGLKTNITPRGISFDCFGDVLVTDFENHRVMKLDGNLRRVLMIRGREGYGDVHEFNRPSGICCDDKGLFALADSKNQRVVVYSSNMDYQYTLDLRHTLTSATGTEKDRPSDVALLPDGRIVVLFETSPDSKECMNPHKTFVQVY